MSDTIMVIYVIVVIGLTTALMFHLALRHRQIVTSLIWWSFIGIFLSSIGGLLLLGTFTPNMANYGNTSGEIYNAYTWGGIILPEYSEMLNAINNLGIVINAMGLGVLVMALLSGFFPKSFFLPPEYEDHTQIH